ncbi:pirin family protein [Comamonas composti]|uniref:pirin family protein n=1 Tax=Comamonas composti TaxID=408558 RepID=UPI00041A7B88|nr:pirin family protein [Comamonas composti]
MLTVRKSRERGYADHGWLRSYHSFSFADYHDPRYMGFGNLRVINEDRIAPGTGFGAHGHRDMEIVSYVLEGELAHKDSLGNEQSIVPGEVQRMSAGTGVVHSEHNPAQGRSTHFLQIWLLPSRQGMAPGYAQKAFGDAQKRGRLCLVGSPEGREGSVQLNADARLYAGLFDGAEQAVMVLPEGRKTYVHLVRGSLQVNGQRLEGGDAAMIEQETQLQLDAGKEAEVLVFDLAP